MSIHLSTDGTIELRGECPVEDAEALLQRLIANPGASVNWSACVSVHAAVLQVLLVAGAVPRDEPKSSFLRDLVIPNLEHRD